MNRELRIRLLEQNLASAKARLETATDKDSVRRQIAAQQARLREEQRALAGGREERDYNAPGWELEQVQRETRALLLTVEQLARELRTDVENNHWHATSNTALSLSKRAVRIARNARAVALELEKREATS